MSNVWIAKKNALVVVLVKLDSGYENVYDAIVENITSLNLRKIGNVVNSFCFFYFCYVFLTYF